MIIVDSEVAGTLDLDFFGANMGCDYSCISLLTSTLNLLLARIHSTSPATLKQFWLSKVVTSSRDGSRLCLDVSEDTKDVSLRRLSTED